MWSSVGTKERYIMWRETGELKGWIHENGVGVELRHREAYWEEESWPTVPTTRSFWFSLHVHSRWSLHNHRYWYGEVRYSSDEIFILNNNHNFIACYKAFFNCYIETRQYPVCVNRFSNCTETEASLKHMALHFHRWPRQKRKRRSLHMVLLFKSTTTIRTTPSLCPIWKRHF